jgi:hypothetical protein
MKTTVRRSKTSQILQPSSNICAVADGEGRFPWALAEGAPPPHLVRAALHVAGLIDTYGSSVAAAHHGYGHYPSGGMYPPEDLKSGECLLLDCGLLQERDGILYPTAQLSAMVAVPPPESVQLLLTHALATAAPRWLGGYEPIPEEAAGAIRELVPNLDQREAMLLALRNRYDPTALAALGALGEEAVVHVARTELEALGRSDLARLTQRVSLISDQLGYDVVAPRIDRSVRRLEVKTMGVSGEGVAYFILSRNEVETGRRDPNWALVVCRVQVDESITIVGWCREAALEPYLPVDGAGSTWREALFTLPETLLHSGIPSAV